MSAAKHTPGPWDFYTAPQPNGCPIVGAKGLMVAMLSHSIHQEDQREVALANASLIAAAPDLLEALCSIIEGSHFEACGCGLPACRTTKLRAVIAKATGEAA